MPEITGFSHLAFTVTDRDKSFAWWSELLGLQELFGGEEDGIRYVVTIHPGSNLILGFREHTGAGTDRFDEHRVGMDHAAMQVASRDELDAWLTRLDELGIDHSEIKDTEYGSVLTFRDPDNIQMEFFAFPG